MLRVSIFNFFLLLLPKHLIIDIKTRLKIIETNFLSPYIFKVKFDSENVTAKVSPH